MLNVHDIVVSEVNGPGKRVVVWLQGCDLKCPGCFNEKMHSTKVVKMYSTQELYTAIKKLAETNKCEGVTFSGGEPLQQVKALGILLVFIKKHYPALSIMLYTGYNMTEILESTMKKFVLSRCDIVIVGRYEKEFPSFHPWTGSSNQMVMYMTDRFSEKDAKGKQKVEVLVSKDGTVTKTGFPTN